MALRDVERHRRGHHHAAVGRKGQARRVEQRQHVAGQGEQPAARQGARHRRGQRQQVVEQRRHGLVVASSGNGMKGLPMTFAHGTRLLSPPAWMSSTRSPPGRGRDRRRRARAARRASRRRCRRAGPPDRGRPARGCARDAAQPPRLGHLQLVEPRLVRAGRGEHHRVPHRDALRRAAGEVQQRPALGEPVEVFRGDAVVLEGARGHVPRHGDGPRGRARGKWWGRAWLWLPTPFQEHRGRHRSAVAPAGPRPRSGLHRRVRPLTASESRLIADPLGRAWPWRPVPDGLRPRRHVPRWVATIAGVDAPRRPSRSRR